MPIPVTLLTGFLGSGKTTLLNAWLRDPSLSDAAVIVNEFGEIGIDHALIAASNDNTIELSTGCLCCMVSGDLVTTLRELNEKLARGDVRPFSRVFIETTGVADPIPVIQSLMTFPVAGRYVLNRVVTVVDAVQGERTLRDFQEASRQVAVADDVILSKTDLANAREGVLAQINALNSSARVLESGVADPVLPSDLLAPGAFNPAGSVVDVEKWIADAGFAAETPHHDHHHAHDHKHHHHESGFTTFTLEFDEPLAWSDVAHWLDALVIAHGSDLLRVKGIFDIAGQPRPIVVQAVQTLFHPPFELPRWPLGEARSRVVFITRNLSRGFVVEVLDTIRGRAPVAAQA